MSKTFKREYVEIEGQEYECTLYYDLGGYNYFTSQTVERGYYVSVMPVERGMNSVTFSAFSGLKQLVVPVKRQSKKALAEAEDKFTEVSERILGYLVSKARGEVA